MTLTGKRLKALREARGLSQAEVASLIGVGRTTYLKYENGENKPVRKLNELAKLFNVSIDFLLGNDSQSISFENYLGKEEKKLLSGYRTLNDGGKKIIMDMIGQLNVARASIPTTALV